MQLSKPNIENLHRLVQELIFPFYQVERHGGLSFAKGRHENDAEHSWSVAFFACALAPQVDPELDIGTVCQFATVHDLAEVYAGDTSNFASDAEKASKEAREHQALQQLSNGYKAFPWIGETVLAYERQDSDEARFVKAADKVLVLLYDFVEKGYFYQKNKITLEHWQETMQAHRRKASKHAGVFKYYDAIWHALLEHPEFFHQAER